MMTLYKQFVKDRDLVAKYKLQQYNANKISKGINEQEYLKNLTDWRTSPLKGNLFKDTAQLFGLNKDKAEMALEDLLDPSGAKYSEELIANKVGLEKLLSAKDKDGNLIWNREEEERLRESLVGFGDVAALRKRDQTAEVKNVYNPFGTPSTSVVRTVKETTPYGTREDVVYTNNDGSYQNIVNGTVVAKTKPEVALAAQVVLGEIAANLGENSTQETIFNQFKKDHYDLYARAYTLKAIDFPAGYTIPTLSNADKNMAGGAVRSITESKLGDSETGFFKSFKETYLEPEELDTNQAILYDNFINGVAESTKYYMKLGKPSDEASQLAYREQIAGWEQIKKGGMFSSDVFNYKRQAAGTLRGPRQSDDQTENKVVTSIPDNSTVVATDGTDEAFTTGTESVRKEVVNNLTGNSNFMATYTEANFQQKNKILDAAARRHPDNVRTSMEDFVEVGESVRLDGAKGYISWNGSQFEQSGVVSFFGAVEGTNKQMTFNDIPEGEMKDLVREKAVTLYAKYASQVDEGVSVSDPDKLFKGSFAQEYGLIPAAAERFLGGGSPSQIAQHRNQPKLKEADKLVDIAGYSFLGITQGDASLARQFLIDAMVDAMPTEQDRLIAAKRIIPEQRTA